MLPILRGILPFDLLKTSSIKFRKSRVARLSYRKSLEESSKIENPVLVQKNPHLSEEDAARVAEEIRQLFFESRGRLPERVVIHKRTGFLKGEREGLLKGLKDIPKVDLVEMSLLFAARRQRSRKQASWQTDLLSIAALQFCSTDSNSCFGSTEMLIQTPKQKITTWGGLEYQLHSWLRSTGGQPIWKNWPAKS